MGVVGLLLLGLAAFRLGSLTGFISRAVLRGFAFGLAITIVVRLVPRLVGVAAPSGPVWETIGHLVRQVSDWHLPALALGLLALAALLWLRRLPQVPGTLLVIVAGIGLTFVADMSRLGIALVGPVQLELPPMILPQSYLEWSRLVQLAVPITLIIFAESWGTMRDLALRHGDRVSPNRELMALGLANVASALVRGMPVGAGFSVGSANEAAGASTRAAGAIASGVVLLLALLAGSLIARIPEPVLGAIVIAALTHALSLAPLVRLFRIRRDFWIAMAAVAGVLMFGILNGMLIAVALSIANLLYDLAHPSISVLGIVPETHDFVDVDRHPEAHCVAGVAIYRPNAPIIFANAESALGAVTDLACAQPADMVVLSLEETNDLDSTGIDALGELETALRTAGKRLILARAHDRVRDVLALAGMGSLAQGSTFSVADAVHRATPGD